MPADAAAALALGALAWSLSDPTRAARLIDLTGLTPDDLRERADDPAVLGAVIGFIAGHEPDLVACAAALAVPPERLIAAGRLLA